MIRSLTLAGTATLALTAAAAFAQTPAPGQAAPQVATADGADLDSGDIIVTAQKRSERLQDVPVAVSVVSGALLERQGGINIENAQYLVPSLNFRKSGTTINQFLFLRGIGTANFSIAAEPSVSAVLDGVVLSRAGEAFTELVDIERIEVLRGPQGTLFGKNASAGVINIVSKRPGDDFGGFLEAGYFSKKEYRARGAVDVPFNTMIKGRFTGFYSQYDGNIYNAAPTVQRQVNGYKHYGVRGLITAEVSEKLSFTLIGDYHKNDDDCCAEVIGTLPGNATAAALPAPRGPGTRQIAQNLVTRTIERGYGGSLQGDLDVGAVGTVTSITAYRRFDNREIRDGDFLPAAYIGFNQLHDDGPQTGNTFSQEIRLTSPGKQKLDYVIGGYYSRARSDRTFTRNDIVCGALTPPAPAALTPCTSALAAPSTFPTGTAVFGSTFKNLSAFGQATFHITDALRVIGGLRYTHDTLDVNHIRRTTLAGPGIGGNFDAGVYNNGAINPAGGFLAGASNGIPFTASTTKNNLSGRAGVQFDLSHDNMLYGTYARGYKGPAYNVFYNMATINTNVIAAETADSYEIGLKNTLLDGRLNINLAGFYAKYKNFQANNPDFVNGVQTTRLTNAGTVSTRGIEVDVIGRFSKAFTMTFGYAYTDAHIDKFLLPPGANASQAIPNGTQLTSAPKNKATLTADYRVITGGLIDVGFAGNATYTDDQLSQLSPDPLVRIATTIPSYVLADVQVSLIERNDRFKLTGYIKNVFGKRFAAAVQTGGPGGSYRYLIPREADTIYGVTGRFNF